MKDILTSEKLTVSAKEQTLKNLDAEYLLLQENGVVYLHEGKEHNISVEKSSFENILYIYRCVNDRMLAEENIKLLNDQINIFSVKGNIVTLTVEEFKELSMLVFQKRSFLERQYMVAKAAIMSECCV